MSIPSVPQTVKKKWISMIAIVMCFPILFELIGQSKNENPKDLSEAGLVEYHKLIQAYKDKIKAQCIQQILDQAAHDVDSIIIEQALFIGADTLDKPFKPERPFPESFVPPNKNVPLQPFLNKSDFKSPFQKKDTIHSDSILISDDHK